MNNAIKTAVSVPADVYRRAESLRRKTGQSRSALYADALKAYFHFQLLREKEIRYAAGYESVPEDIVDVSVAMAAQAKVLKKEDW